MTTIPFNCPYCDVELDPPDGAWYHTCHNCGKRLDLKSQYAYLRGLDAFVQGQELMDTISPRKRRSGYVAQIDQSLNLFLQAYSSIQVAFQAELEEVQRSVGIEMMASMSQEFMRRNMLSSLEMNYWSSLMVEITAQKEYDELREKLARAPANGVFSYLKRMRWLSRQKQLKGALVKLDERIRMLESQIEFVDLPRARNRKWKP